MPSVAAGEQILTGCEIYGVHHNCEGCPNLKEMGDSISYANFVMSKDKSPNEYIRKEDFLKKAEAWFNEHVNIPQEVETDENGVPLAVSYIKYAKARFDAAKEMVESFKQAMEND